ncbi:hypothetical protein BKA69DRAFT_1090036 [Paraphysoderma sedebokerense]|nr:hypothetical protein BKA69DRAFT_1097311 [Paraphysoderma sedebokerense]KAI9138680.1 hypothetical protein BKA69DRAFT_1090036 [Paraphysoderma sedebokerense]
MNFDSESSLSLQSVSSFQTKPTSSSPSVTSPFPCLQLGSITINSTGTESLRVPQVPNFPPFSPSKTLSPKYISLSDNPPLINFTYDTILQSSQCGLSPFIKSLPPSMPLSPPILEQGGTPAMNLGTIGKFGEYVAGTLWSWDVLQPVNGSVSNCALIWIETGGRWKVGNCSETNFLACQSKNDPHDWTFTSARSSWHDANTKTQSSRERSCSENYFFSVPKTPLQNYFLLTKMIEKNIEKAWLNYADLSTDGCWVEGGGKCRYADEDATIQQIINVTIIGGILVLIIVAVFLYFRCRRYLRVSKGQRRRNDVRERLKYVEVAGFPA